MIHNTVTTFIPETEQMSEHQNGTLQSLGERHAITISTSIDLPAELHNADQATKAAFVLDLLNKSSAATNQLLHYDVQIGHDTDHETEKLTLSDYRDYDQCAAQWLERTFNQIDRNELARIIYDNDGYSNISGVDLGVVVSSLQNENPERLGLIRVFHEDDPDEATSATILLVERWVECYANAIN